MESLKKKHQEIIALYKLEKALKDIYVEGNCDRVFFDNFLKRKKCNKQIIPIEVVDFTELSVDYLEGLDMKSNRNKLIILAKLLQENIPATSVRCIIDKDFDDYLESFSNYNLLKTDFSCLESYLFCEEVIEKFLTMGVGSFPVNATFVLEQLSNVLKSLFCLRLLRELKFRSTQLVDIDGNLSITKEDAKINFNELEYLNKFITKNKLTKYSRQIIDDYYELKSKLNMEIRHHIQGHDFIDVFYLYVNKIKNTAKYKEANFDRTLFLTVECKMIENYPLFQSILL